MSLIRSQPDGYARTGWRVIAAVTVGICFIPAIIGFVFHGLLSVAGEAIFGPGWLSLVPLSLLLAWSPFLTAPFWALMGIGAAWALHHGIYGSLIAAGFGALAGAGAAETLGAPVMIPLGAVFATFHRFALAVLRPMAF